VLNVLFIPLTQRVPPRFHPDDQTAAKLSLNSRIVYDTIQIPDNERKAPPAFKEFSDAVSHLPSATPRPLLARRISVST